MSDDFNPAESSPAPTVADVSPAPIEWQPLASSPTPLSPATPPESAPHHDASASPTAPSFAPAPSPVSPDFVATTVGASTGVTSGAMAPARAATDPLLAMLLGAVLACGLLGAGIGIGRAGRDEPDRDILSVAPAAAGVSARSGNAIVRAVAAVGPAVMNVDSTFGQSNSNELPLPGESGPREGKGTGFVIDSRRGLMLTNAHVVAGARKIQVTTRDGDKFTGRVLGYDRRSDIAVVVLSNKSLPQARLATFHDARELPIGDWAIAIGNPFAQENTVTVGVLSAVGRTLPVPASEHGEAFALTDMMQTDAAINPGNSGGPLCNLRGEVIGINTAIIPFGQGLGFTIPINKAKVVADQIIKNGKVSHPYIGVVVVAVSDGLQNRYGLPDESGALVRGVEPGSPAAKAGLLPGDIIRKLDGQTMKSNEDVVKFVGRQKVGVTLRIEVLRNPATRNPATRNTVPRNTARQKTLTLQVGDRPD